MSDFKFNCPHCQQSLEAPQEMLGTVIDCPACNNRIQLPSPQPEPPPKAPPQSAPQPQKRFVPKKTQSSHPSAGSGKRRLCPFCGENILEVAIKCKHCGTDLEASKQSVSPQVGLSALFSAKARDGVLIAVACLSLFAFFMPNAVITIPILGKMKFSMYDVVSAFGNKPKIQTENIGRGLQPDTKDMIRSFKITESGVGGIVCAIAVLGIMLHYLLSIVWCVCRFAFRKSVAVINTIWLAGAIQFPVLLTIGTSIILASMKREMAQEKDSEFAAAIGTALMNSLSIEAGLIMWALFVVAICGLAMPVIARKLAVGTGST